MTTFYKGQYVKVTIAMGPFPANWIYTAQGLVQVVGNSRRSGTRDKKLRVLGSDGLLYDVSLNDVSTPTTTDISLHESIYSKQVLPKLAFKLDGVNDQITTKYPSGTVGYGTIKKMNDGLNDYWQVNNSFFGILSVGSLNSRAIQVQKYTYFFDVPGKSMALGSYSGVTNVTITTAGKIQVELQGTGSIRITGSTTLQPGIVYTIAVRINNSLPSGTARVVGDCDIFVDGVMETKTSVGISNSTTTNTIRYWGAIHSTSTPFTGGLYNTVIWDYYIDDIGLERETLSRHSVINPGPTLILDTTTAQPIQWKQDFRGTVVGNISSLSDVNGEYIYCNGNKSSGTGLGSTAGVVLPSSNITYTQLENFSFTTALQLDTLPVAGFSGLFGAGAAATIAIDAGTGKARAYLIGSSTVTFDSISVLNVSQVYRFDFTYDALAKKFYFYIDGVIQNPGGITGPTTFSTGSRTMGDDAIGGGSVESCKKRYYFARIVNKTLSSSDIAQEILGGLMEVDDPMIAMSRRPENLKYNVQYLANSKDLANASWIKGSGVTVTSNNALDEDGNMTADTVSRTGVSDTVSQIYGVGAGISGAVIASRTFKVKINIRAVSGSPLFRLRLSQVGVQDFTSTDFTATSVMQEFEYNVTLAAGTGASALRAMVLCGSTNLAGVVEIGEITLRHVNRYLFDNSPNIGDRIGWKTPKIMTYYAKPTIDAANNLSAQPCILMPYVYSHIRDSLNYVRVRYDIALQAREVSFPLGNGFRKEVFCVCAFDRNESNQTRRLQLYCFVDGVLIGSSISNMTIDAPTSTVNTVVTCGKSSSAYYQGYLRNPSVYIGQLSANDPQNMANGLEPSTAVKYLEWMPQLAEGNSDAIDYSDNNRTGQILGGVTKEYIYTS